MHNKFEALNTITQAIYEHAIPRPYDMWILYVAIGTFFISSILAYLSYCLNKKQSKILEQQNNIALFDKRFDNLQVAKIFVNNIYNHGLAHIVVIETSKLWKIDITGRKHELHMHLAALCSSIGDFAPYSKENLQPVTIYTKCVASMVIVTNNFKQLFYFFDLSQVQKNIINELIAEVEELLKSTALPDEKDYYKNFDTFTNNYSKYKQLVDELETHLHLC